MNTKTYKVHTCDFYSSLILKKRQEGSRKRKKEFFVINANMLRWYVW